MTTGATPPFGALLRHHRRAAGQTQEDLAERAGVSAPTVSALERGVSQLPHLDTVERLVDALDLAGAERAAFTRAARRDATSGPPAPSPGPPRTNVPSALTSFVGREQELVTVRRLLRDTRLLTLTGPGGCGKTRLALQVAGALLGDYPEGVWLVELAALSDPELAPQAVAAALGVVEEAGRSIVATVSDRLAAGAALLVLDNCEHLVDACAGLAAALLRSCSLLRILATSREALEVAGEAAYQVPSLPVPDPMPVLPPEELLDFAAARLFVERARARRTDFALNSWDAAAVARICRRLDGIPLAIELAAARIDVMAVEDIDARLDDCFRLLTAGPRSVLPRQQTLRATLDWSYGLLGVRERTLLARLSVFAGGWTLEAAEVVCAGPGPGEAGDIGQAEVLDLLGGLVRKSLALLEGRTGAPRYRLLEMVRQYAAMTLGQVSDGAAVRERHLGWCLALAEWAAPLLQGREQDAWLVRLERDHDNLRAALRWARESGQVAPGLRLAGALRRFWLMRGHLSEGRAWLEGLLAQAEGGGAATAALRAAGLAGAGVLAAGQGDYKHATARHRESLTLYRAIGDRGGSAEALHNLGVVAQHQGDYERAVRVLEDSLALRRDLGDRMGMAESLGLLGLLATWQGAYGRAEALLGESLALYRDLGDARGIASTLSSLGWPAKFQGHYSRAEALSAEGLAIYRDLEDQQGAATVLRSMGIVAVDQGEYARAEALLGESLSLSRALGSKQGIATALADLARVANHQGGYARAEALLGESLTLYWGTGSMWGIAYTLHNLGRAAHGQGDHMGATGFYEESLALYRTKGEQHCIAGCLEGLAGVATMQGQEQRAARLLAAAAAVRDAAGAPLPPVDRPEHERIVGRVRTILGDGAFAAAFAAAQGVPLEKVITDALGVPSLA